VEAQDKLEGWDPFWCAVVRNQGLSAVWFPAIPEVQEMARQNVSETEPLGDGAEPD
jgi:hypothetical protein